MKGGAHAERVEELEEFGSGGGTGGGGGSDGEWVGRGGMCRWLPEVAPPERMIAAEGKGWRGAADCDFTSIEQRFTINGVFISR